MTLNPHDEEAMHEGLQAEERDNVQSHLDTVLQFYCKAFDKAVAYTNVIMLGGYAALFTAWNFAGKLMDSTDIAIVGSLITISCLAFTFWEVYKILYSGRMFKQISNDMAKNPNEAIKLLFEHGEEQLKHNFMHMKLWVAMLWVALPTGFGAALMIAYVFLAHIIRESAELVKICV